jgi:hypothetical protein
MGSAAGAKALTDFVRLTRSLKRRSSTVQQALVSFFRNLFRVQDLERAFQSRLGKYIESR